MTALHPHHSRLVEGYCCECGADLADAGVYADQHGPEVECPLCHIELDPNDEDDDDILDERTEAQALVWGLVDEARRERDEARRLVEQLRAMLRPRLSASMMARLGWFLKRCDNSAPICGDDLAAVRQAVSIVLASSVAVEVQDG